MATVLVRCYRSLVDRAEANFKNSLPLGKGEVSSLQELKELIRTARPEGYPYIEFFSLNKKYTYTWEQVERKLASSEEKDIKKQKAVRPEKRLAQVR